MKPVTRTLKNGTHLFRENDRSRELYIIQSGKIQVYKTVGTKEVKLAVMGKGAVLGEMALIDGKPRSASARVIEECMVMQIDAEAIEKKIQGVQPWFLHLIKLISQKIRNTNIRLHSISPQRQGASIIITLGYFFGENQYSLLNISSTELKLTHLLGSNHLKVKKVLKRLCDLGYTTQSADALELARKEEFLEYCRYLRFLLRGSYGNIEGLHPATFHLADLITGHFPPLLEHEGGSYKISGDHLWSLFLQCNLRDDYDIISEKLFKDGLLVIEKKHSECQIEHPFSRSELRVQNPGWMKLSLYNKYKDLKPDV